jgi:hypothetical protein
MADQTAETQMDAGPAKIRRRFTTNTTRYQLSVAMDQTQLATFETFYYTTLQGGSLSFDWVEPVTRVAQTFRFRKPVPSQRAIMSGNVTLVSFNLECLT